MILSRRRSSRTRHCPGKTELSGCGSNADLTIPTHFRCPISLELMKDPVTLSTGITYDRESIENWIETGNQKCPVTNQALRTLDQIPNHAIRRMIQEWCVENRSNGIERIPTPRTPVSSREVSEICSKIIAATRRGDKKKCVELVKNIKARAGENQRNKKRISESGTGGVLSDLFEVFATVSVEGNEVLLEETLSALTWMFPIGAEGLSKLGSPSSLRCMSWFLKGEDLFARRNAVLVLKQLLFYSDQMQVKSLISEIDGLFEEALVKIIKEQTCPKATKASLRIVYFLVSRSTINEKIASRFVDSGFVSLGLEILVGAERSVAEKVLGVLDGVCSCNEGMEKAQSHALMLPILLENVVGVSDIATEFSVSVLWKLCKKEDGVDGGDGDQQLVEAIQLGAFGRLLVVLQVGCGERTKDKITELLKLMNQYRDRLGYHCFDSLMNLKRP